MARGWANERPLSSAGVDLGTSPAPTMDSSRSIGTAFLALGAVTWLLLVVGATVRVHGAGLSCPDWPLCFGQLVPRLDFSIFLEWGHRLFAGTVSVGFLGLGIVVFRQAALKERIGRWYLISVGVLVLQIGLGGLTVLKLLAFWSVTSHLLTGNLFCFLLVNIGITLRQSPQPATPGCVGPMAVLLAALTFLQLALGGLVSSNMAGLACPTWPSCNGLWFPDWTGIVGLQVIHRLGAYTVLLAALGYAAMSFPHAQLRRRAFLIVGLVLAQITLGVLNVFWALPVETAVLHSATADLLLLCTLVNARLVLGAVAAPVQAFRLAEG